MALTMKELSENFKSNGKKQTISGVAQADGSYLDTITIIDIEAEEKTSGLNKWGKPNNYFIFTVKYKNDAGGDAIQSKNLVSFSDVGKDIVEYISSDDLVDSKFKVWSRKNDDTGYYDWIKIEKVESKVVDSASKKKK